MKTKISSNDLQNEISQIRKRFPALKDDAAFVFWFLNAYLVDKEDIAMSSLTGKEGGKGGEKNMDAIYIDEKAQQCNIIQGKYRASDGVVSEKRNDVLTFADLSALPWETKAVLDSFYSELDPIALQKFKVLVNCVKSKKYKMNLYYVTTGKCSDTIIKEAKERVRKAHGPVDIDIITYNRVLQIFKDYLDDITPHIPPLRLRIVSEGTIHHEGLIHRFDPKTEIESWVFSISGYDIAQMYAKVGRRLFAKNIRGWLGADTDINESISETIKKEPYNFWYYNNGITIVCNDAKREVQGGEDVIIVEGAQVINGQQTTITLHDSNNDCRNTNILAKIIKIPRNHGDDEKYDYLVNSIVRATNWQNYIVPSDLVSNDYIQVHLERELRKKQYQYIRKRMSKSEARKAYGQGYYQITKTELAQAVAACLFDPVLVRKGKENLFEDPYYKTIFKSRSLSFYLSKYWLMRQVQSAAKGYPERAYAKWVVLNYAWNILGNNIGDGYIEKRFRYACERNIDKIKSPLSSALSDIFRAALQFYRLNRGKGEEAKDVSSFFQLSKLHKEFSDFCQSNKNSYRERINKNISKFRSALEALNVEE